MQAADCRIIDDCVEIVEVKVTVPMPRDEKTKELLRELAKLNPEDPRAELFKNV